MLDGLDRFWRMRALTDIRELKPDEARGNSALHPRLGGIGGGTSGEEVFSGFRPDPGDRQAAIAATIGFDYVLSRPRR